MTQTLMKKAAAPQTAAPPLASAMVGALPARRVRAPALVAAFALALAQVACGDVTQLPPLADVGANPTLPPPVMQRVPTVNIAPALGWPGTHALLTHSPSLQSSRHSMTGSSVR